MDWNDWPSPPLPSLRGRLSSVVTSRSSFSISSGLLLFITTEPLLSRTGDRDFLAEHRNACENLYLEPVFGVKERSPGRQGLGRAALSSRSSSLGLRQADSSASAWWVGTLPTPKPPDGPGLGSSDPRTSITWLFTLDILLRTSAIWALRRISTPESGTDRLTTWGRLSRSFRECGWA